MQTFCACLRLFPAATAKHSARVSGDLAPYQAKESPAGQEDDAEHIHRLAGRHIVGSRPAGARPGPAWERAFLLCNDDPPYGVTPRLDTAPETWTALASVARVVPPSSARGNPWGTLASWTLMWW